MSGVCHGSIVISLAKLEQSMEPRRRGSIADMAKKNSFSGIEGDGGRILNRTGSAVDLWHVHHSSVEREVGTNTLDGLLLWKLLSNKPYRRLLLSESL